ncbi:unnamed protein product [Mortierella alpina]
MGMGAVQNLRCMRWMEGHQREQQEEALLPGALIQVFRDAQRDVVRSTLLGSGPYSAPKRCCLLFIAKKKGKTVLATAVEKTILIRTSSSRSSLVAIFLSMYTVQSFSTVKNRLGRSTSICVPYLGAITSAVTRPS